MRGAAHVLPGVPRGNLPLMYGSRHLWGSRSTHAAAIQPGPRCRLPVGSQDADDDACEADLTGVYPYARLELNPRVSAWDHAGAGTMTLHRENHPPNGDRSFDAHGRGGDDRRGARRLRAAPELRRRPLRAR